MTIENKAEKLYETNISAPIDSREYDFLWSNLNERLKTTHELKRIRILKHIKGCKELNNCNKSEE